MKRHLVFTGGASLVIALAIGSSPSIAAAADAPPPAGDAASGQVQDIIVTAQKRSENIQKVSEQVTAATGAKLEQLHVTSATDLTYIVPALTFSESITPTSSGFAVRGVGTSTFSSGVEQSVSTVIDGVVYGQPQSTSALNDVDHVEILEGPQGMLFGKNASAGLVDIITNNPQLDSLGGRLSTTFGDGDEHRVQGVLNVPLGDTAAFRAVGFYNHTDGFISDVAIPSFPKLNNEDNYGFRAKLLWEPTSNLKVLLSADYTRDDSICCFYTTRSDTPPNPAFPLNGIVQQQERLFGITPGPNNTEVALDKPLGEQPGADLRQYAGGSAQIDYNFGGGYTLTSVTAYRRNTYSLDFDADQTPLDLFDQDGGPQSYSQTSEEVRLTSPIGKVFDYVAGFFYYNSEYDTKLIAGGPFLSPLGIPGTVIADTTANVSSQDYAVYAQGTFHITDSLRLKVGGRETHDDLQLFYSNVSDPKSQLGLGYFGQTPATFTQKTSATDFSWKVSGEYDIAPAIMGYATVAKGYKGPGFSALPGAVATQNQSVQPEIPMDYEIGIKSSLFDHRLTLDATVFVENFKNFQAQVYDSNTVPPAFRVTNAGALESKGFEIQATAKPTPDLTLGGNLAYIDAHYDSLKNISCYFSQTYPVVTAPCAVVNGNEVDNASGNRLANAPVLSWNVSADYRQPIGDFVTDWETDYNWRSDNQFSANGDPNTIQAAYGLWNASLTVGPQNSAWTLQAYVRNILDQHFSEFILPDAGDSKGGYAQFITRDSFRHYGVTLNVKF
jgi:iron complex outermembrane receptor protein